MTALHHGFTAACIHWYAPVLVTVISHNAFANCIIYIIHSIILSFLYINVLSTHKSFRGAVFLLSVTNIFFT